MKAEPTDLDAITGHRDSFGTVRDEVREPYAAPGDGADPDVDRIGTGRRAPDRDLGPNR